MSKEHANNLANAIAGAVYAVHRGGTTAVVDEALGNVFHAINEFHDGIMSAAGCATIKRPIEPQPDASGFYHCPTCQEAFSSLANAKACCDGKDIDDCSPDAYHDLTPKA